jgi:transcriptional regulator with XRE-family HTH domain
MQTLLNKCAKLLRHVKSPPQPGMVSRYERGQREPKLLVLLEFARIAGVSMDVLVDDKLHPPEKCEVFRGAKGIEENS